MATRIAYVVARSQPGGSAIRERLFETVLTALHRLLIIDVAEKDSGLKTLYSLMVLYNYTEMPAVGAPVSSRRSVAFWPLKSLVETTALRIGCHRATEKAEKSLEQDLDPQKIAVRKYSCRWWLFVMSHQFVF